MIEKVKAVIEDLRQYLQADGGDLEFVDLDEKTGIVKVRLQEACQGCPMSQMTLKQGVEARLKEEVPGVTEVIAVP